MDCFVGLSLQFSTKREGSLSSQMLSVWYSQQLLENPWIKP
jgi:hypothetical protein